ncbi:MAG TPA: DUF6788 family protein [Streptosporangiaceae bacterium]|jgi:Family of unknown function (DUF6788)|nr:DUF6788 family protein [Streptosporangiaceae bacterium]
MREAGDPGCDNSGVSPTPAQQAQAARIAAELAALGFALPGTLADRMTRCGRANCRCHADPPRLHGPYHPVGQDHSARRLVLSGLAQ